MIFRSLNLRRPISSDTRDPTFPLRANRGHLYGAPGLFTGDVTLIERLASELLSIELHNAF